MQVNRMSLKMCISFDQNKHLDYLTNMSGGGVASRGRRMTTASGGRRMITASSTMRQNRHGNNEGTEEKSNDDCNGKRNVAHFWKRPAFANVGVWKGDRL